VLFGFVGFGFVDGAVLVLGRRIDRVKFQLFVGRSVYDIVVVAGRHNYGCAVAHGVLVSVDNYFSLAFLEAEKLVAVVNLGADFFAGIEAHYDKLAPRRCVKHPPVVLVLKRYFLNVSKVSFHTLYNISFG